MSITMMGTIGAYTKTLRLQTQWKLKQQSGDLSGHKKSLDEYLQSTQADRSAAHDEETQERLRSIHAKLDAGTKLTIREREYLKAKDPQSYAKLEAEEEEQRAYERELRRCKTKEEVQRLKSTYLNTSLMTARAVEHNPAIPAEKKLEIMTREKRRCDRIQESTQVFVRKGEYEALPTDQERAKAEREEAQRRRPLQDAESPAEKPAAPPKERGPEKASGEEPRRREEKEKPKVRVESPEARKTRRAKAKAAYAPPPDRLPGTAPSEVDIKA